MNAWLFTAITGVGGLAFAGLAIHDFVIGIDQRGALASGVAGLTSASTVVAVRMLLRFADPRRMLSPIVRRTLPHESVDPRERMFSYDATVVLQEGQEVKKVRIVAGRIMRVGGKARLPFAADRISAVRVVKDRTGGP